MSDDLYDDDILWWSEQQAELLRRVAAGEQADNIDNIIEEIEAAEPTGPAVPMSDLYADVLAGLPEEIDATAPLPVPQVCPVTLDELLAPAPEAA